MEILYLDGELLGDDVEVVQREPYLVPAITHV